MTLSGVGELFQIAAEVSLLKNYMICCVNCWILRYLEHIRRFQWSFPLVSEGLLFTQVVFGSWGKSV